MCLQFYFEDYTDERIWIYFFWKVKDQGSDMILAFNLILTSFNVIKAPNVHGKNGFLQSRLTLASPRLLIVSTQNGCSRWKERMLACAWLPKMACIMYFININSMYYYQQDWQWQYHTLLKCDC